jgi:large repetitive protein
VTVTASPTGSTAISVRASDPDGDRVTYLLVSGPSKGALGPLTIENGEARWSYLPNAGATGEDTFTIIVEDANGGFITVIIRIVLRKSVPPQANDQNVSALEDSAQTILLSATDPDNDSLTFTITKQPSNGALGNIIQRSANTAEVVYTPSADYSGSDSFTFEARDGSGLADTGVVTIGVVAVNDAPRAAGDRHSLLEDATLNVPAPGVLANDRDADGDALTATLVSGAANGTVVLNTNGSFTYTPNPNFFGADAFTYSASDGIPGSRPSTVTVTLTIDPVNDAPSFARGGDRSVLEDAGAQTVSGWATAVSAGPAETQGLSFVVTSNLNAALFAVAPAVDANGNLTWTAAPNANGTAVITIKLVDDGGTTNGGVNESAAQTFTIQVNAVNDAPSFSKGANITALEDSAAFSSPFATAIRRGPADEASQAVSFIVTNDAPAMFAVPPAIAADGTLTFTPAANSFGIANVSVAIADDGGTSNGGIDTSAAQTFTITLTNVNDAPSFTAGGPQTILEDAGAQSLVWATGIAAGPNETDTMTFVVVSNDNAALFSIQPSINASGQLTYTPASNASGVANLVIKLTDNGGMANGGVNESPTRPLVINVNAVNDAPSFTKGADVARFEDSGAYSAAFATAISKGPADESAQTLAFNVTNNNNALFSVQPAIAADGTLSFTHSHRMRSEWRR